MTDISKPPLSNPPPLNPADNRIWIEKGVALKVIRHYFEEGRALIRIAAGFFTIRGYNLIRGSARGKHMSILVGVEEPGEQRARQMMIEQIMHDLRTGIDQDRYQAVLEFVEKLRAGAVRIVDARALDHHAKVYIVDETVAIVASSNVSQRGFIDAIESGTVITQREDVLAAIIAYEEHFRRAHDITAELLARLEDWLKFRKPWEVYLKTLDALNVLDDLPNTKPTYRNPVSFQLSIVAMALRQINAYGGAMIVASTGLGKTIIGTDIARRLHETRRITNVLIIAPAPVHEEWRKRLRSANITPELRTPDIWDRQDAEEIDSLASDLDGQWLIIIDECHEFRNRFKKIDEGTGKKKKQKREVERLAFQRLVPVINRHKPKTLLLTATPYSTTVDNINNQLHLLPHTNIVKEGQSTFLPDEYAGDKAWHVEKPEALRDLEVASVLTTPAVAKYWAEHENGSAFVWFGNERQYFPKINLYRSNIAPVLEEDIARLLALGCFKINSNRPSRRTLIEKHVRVAWGSSPRALQDVLEKVVSPDGYQATFKKATFRMPLAERQEHVEPVLDKLRQLTFSDDLKLRQFFAVLDPILAQDNKVVVFSERLPTVAYLEEAIQILRPEWRLGSTVRLTEAGKYKQKTSKAVARLLTRFAPLANKSAVPVEPIDIFLSTDAFGVGVNMQDAQVVVNYDLAWTPIQPAQRAGRILRLWHEPRTIELYAFVPYISPHTRALLSDKEYRPIELVAQRWATLIARHTWSSKILELPILTVDAQQNIDLLTLPTAEIDVSSVYLEELAEGSKEEDETEASPILTRHVSRYERHKAEAQHLPSDIVSAKLYDGSIPLIYVLLRHADQAYWVVYDLERKRLIRYTEYGLLNLIEADPAELPAFVDMETVEAASDECLRAWHKQHEEISLDEVVRECALYLKPVTNEDHVSDMLVDIAEVD